MEKLKKCPFCGNDDISDFTPDVEHNCHCVTCLKCGACGPEKETHEEAIELWNTRPDINIKHDDTVSTIFFCNECGGAPCILSFDTDEGRHNPNETIKCTKPFYNWREGE